MEITKLLDKSVETSTPAYSEFAKENNMPMLISLEELEERMEQDAREEEADEIILAEERRMPD